LFYFRLPQEHPSMIPLIAPKTLDFPMKNREWHFTAIDQIKSPISEF
jgi:hypothetical protein